MTIYCQPQLFVNDAKVTHIWGKNKFFSCYEPLKIIKQNGKTQL